MRTSFVIPAYDEEQLLPRTLEALHLAGRETGPDYEIVVADDGSTDGTAQVARAAGAHVVTRELRNIAATRNSGAAAATGDLLIFVDADTIVPPATVRAARDAVHSGVLAGGCVCSFDEPMPRWAKRIERPVMWLYRKSRLTTGAFLFATRAAFDAVGGFDESRFGGEEVLIARKLDRYSKRHGQRFTIVPERVVTSARKLRTHSGREILGALCRTMLSGARRRESMQLWYGPRRPDPERDR